MPTITLTPNLQLQIPSYDLSNWHVPMAYDLQLLDSLLSGQKAIASLLLQDTGAVALGSEGDAVLRRHTLGGLAVGNGNPGDTSGHVYAGFFHGDGSHLTNLAQLSVGLSWKQYLVTVYGGQWLVNGSPVAALSGSTTQQIPLFTTDPRQMFHGLMLKHAAVFTGGSVLDVTASVGTAPTPDLLMLASGDTFDVAQSVSAAHFYTVGGVRSLGFAATGVVLQITATSGNVSALTQGTLEVGVCSAILP